MSGRDAKDVLADSREARQALRTFGLTPLDPVEEEGVTLRDGTLGAPEEKLAAFWKRDRQLIRSAHVMLDLSGPRKSEGTAHEIGYARYFLWRPVVRVWPNLGPSIARFEDDVIARDVWEAAKIIKAEWGTPYRRFRWLLRLYLRCRLKAAYYEAKGIFNALR